MGWDQISPRRTAAAEVAAVLLRGPLLDVFNVLGKVPCLGFRGMGSKLRGSQQKLLGILSDCVGVVRIDIRWLVILRVGLGGFRVQGFKGCRGACGFSSSDVQGFGVAGLEVVLVYRKCPRPQNLITRRIFIKTVEGVNGKHRQPPSSNPAQSGLPQGSLSKITGDISFSQMTLSEKPLEVLEYFMKPLLFIADFVPPPGA